MGGKDERHMIMNQEKVIPGGDSQEKQVPVALPAEDIPAEWRHSVTGVFVENGPIETRDIIIHTFTGTIAKAMKDLNIARS